MRCGLRIAGDLRPDARKPATILFNDVTDSARLAERLEPEALRRLMWRYFETVSRSCERHGGVVEKFIGDAVMAVFGIPAALEDHALRAVRAAADLRTELARLNAELEREWGVRLETRTGVNSGEVVSGDPAGGQALVTGDAVNMAARLEQGAAPGETLIGDATLRLLDGAAEVEAVDPLRVKGREEPLVAWRLVGVAPPAGQPARALDQPMLGRDRQLATLREAFERVARDRVPHRTVLIGPAGIGKSRLAHELRESVSGRGRELVGGCLSYGDGITFWPLAEMVRQAAGEDAQAGIERLMEDDPRAELIANRVTQAVGIAEGRATGPDLSWAIRTFLETLAAREPLLLVFEDLHWAEDPLLDLIEQLCERSGDVPMLVVCLAREELIERRPGWAEPGERASAMALGPLSEGDTHALIAELLPADGVPDAVRDELVARAEGNPLFVEQMLALLREDGPGAESSIPPTIQALLAARLDRLPVTELSVIGAAAVVGREFWPEAVGALQPGIGPAAVESALADLSRRELVRPGAEGLVEEDGLSFRHGLIRDAAYESLTKESRAGLHERFAVWMEDRHPERLVELEAILGYHLEQAWRYRTQLAPAGEHARALARRAAGHLGAAGRRAARAREDGAAVNLLSRARELLPEGSRERLRLAPLIGESLEGVAEHKRAAEVYEGALVEAAAAGDRRVEGLTRLGRVHSWFVTRPELTADEIADEIGRAIEVLGEAGERRGVAEGLRLLGESRMYAGRAGEGQGDLERALEQADPDLWPRTWNALSFSMGMCLLEGPAHLDRAAAFALARLDEARARGLRSFEADMLHVLGAIEGRRAHFDNARAALADSAAMSDELGLRYMRQWSMRTLGHVELAAGDPRAAEEALRFSHRVLEEMALYGSLAETAVPLADALCRQGRHDEAERVLDALREEWATDDASVEAPRLAVRAKILAARGLGAEAEREAEVALKLVRRTDWACLQADTLLARADVLAAAGHAEQAAPFLEEALRIAAAKGYEAAGRLAGERLARIGAGMERV